MNQVSTSHPGDRDVDLQSATTANQHHPASSTMITGTTRVTSGSNASTSISSGKHCEFCLIAEFDIDRGSTLSYQYPNPIGHDNQ